MSSGKNKFGEIEFECDHCGDVEGSEEKNFQDAWIEIQKQGWVYQGNNKHCCATCKGENK